MHNYLQIKRDVGTLIAWLLCACVLLMVEGYNNVCIECSGLTKDCGSQIHYREWHDAIQGSWTFRQQYKDLVMQQEEWKAVPHPEIHSKATLPIEE